MPLTGTLTFASGNGSQGSGSWYLLGADNKRYIVGGETGTGSEIQIGCADTLATLANISESQWQTDFAGLGLVGAAGTYSMSQAPIPAPGTPYFYVLGYQTISGHTYADAVGVRYKINASGVVVVDGGFIYRTASSPTYLGLPSTCWCVGATVIGTTLYAVAWIGHWTGGGTDDAWYLLALPLSGTPTDTSTGSWSAKITRLADYTYFRPNTGRYYRNLATILQDADGIGILTYCGAGEVGTTYQGNLSTTGSEYWVIDPATNSIVTTQADMTSDFGQPWSDSGTKHDTSSSINDRDDYTAPTANYLDTNKYELIFARSFSDAYTSVRLRRYQIDNGTVTFLNTTDTTVSGPTSAMDMGLAPRSGDDLLLAMTDAQHVYFGQLTLALGGGGTDAPATAVASSKTQIFG